METRSSNIKTQKQKLPASDLAEDTLEIVARIAPLDEDSLKALRLVCKRTKTAATGRVQKFKLLDLEQDAALLRASGLLDKVATLTFDLDLTTSGDEAPFASIWSRAVDLFHTTVDVCCKSAKRLEVKLQASPEILMASGCVMGKSSWNYLEDLSMVEYSSMPGFLSGFFARPGSFPALQKVSCEDASAADIEILSTSGIVRTLRSFCAFWSPDANESNRAPAMVTAMRNLLQKATKLDSLHLGSHTFEFFDNEKLDSLTHLIIEHSGLPPEIVPSSLSPLLSRPWPMLKTFIIGSAILTEDEVVRIFESEDTLPAVLHLRFEGCVFRVDALLSIRRPRLESLFFDRCTNGNALISKMATLMKGGAIILPKLRFVWVDAIDENSTLVVTALSDLLSCPAMTALEKLSVLNAELTSSDPGLLHHIANSCPKLKELDLSSNKLGRSAIALLQGYGNMGVWPNLEKLGVLKQELDDEDPNRLDGEHPYLPKLDVEETLRRAWPNLEVY